VSFTAVLAVLASGSAIAQSPHDVMVRGALVPGFDIAVDTSEEEREWLVAGDGALQMAYPSDQDWGAVFVTARRGEGLDVSQFAYLAITMRGTTGGERIEVGLRDADDPTDGSEQRIEIVLSAQWETYHFALARFATADLSALRIVPVFVFTGADARTVEVSAIQFRSGAPVLGGACGLLSGKARVTAKGIGKAIDPVFTLDACATETAWGATDRTGNLLSATFGDPGAGGRRGQATLDGASRSLLESTIVDLVNGVAEDRVTLRFEEPPRLVVRRGKRRTVVTLGVKFIVESEDRMRRGRYAVRVSGETEER